MGFKCGIVGLPNVGKSTLFNALTSSEIQAENYPFCTIEPNVGMVEVPDKRLDALTDIAQPKKTIPTTMEFVDIAGLVEGASKGEGLGNKFLANIREVQAIVHVVRCFEDENVIHVAGRVDPLADIGVIETELALADLETLEKAISRAAKLSKSGDKTQLHLKELYESALTHVDAGHALRTLDCEEEDLSALAQLFLLTMKPVMYIANVNEDSIDGNPLIDSVRTHAQTNGSDVVVICASLEAEMAGLDRHEKVEFLQEVGLKEPGLDLLIRAGYRLLGLQTYFTAGPKEVRAWTVSVGSTAPQAAGVIHTDFERGFIRAEVAAYADFVQYKGELGAREAGRYRLEGKDYVMQDGDVVHFRFNV